MTVYFEDRFGDSRMLGKADSSEAAYQIINEFLKQHNYKSRYIRTWSEDNKTWYDVGSHSEFFYTENE